MTTNRSARSPLAERMRPSTLDDLGLEPALRWYTHRQAALTGLRAEVRMDLLEQRLDPVIETACFRVAQEALTNVAKHAGANHVQVTLQFSTGGVKLVVADDGIGFSPEQMLRPTARRKSYGLLGMQEHASTQDEQQRCLYFLHSLAPGAGGAPRPLPNH